MKRPVRLFQVATGNVGTEMIRRVMEHADLELVGLHCYTPEKVGRDAGKVGGMPAVNSLRAVVEGCPGCITTSHADVA